MHSLKRRPLLSWTVLSGAFALLPKFAHAVGIYDPGASDTEIKIGQTIAYSGPASMLSALGKVQTAYFAKLNNEGGINGRKITLISLDDAYSPPKTVEQVKRLVEADEVLLVSGSNGAATNNAVRKYLASRRVPQLMVLSGSNFNDPRAFPSVTPAAHSYDFEGRLYAKYLLDTQPDAKVAVLYQNDDYGRDTLRGFKEGLGVRAAQIVGETSYQTTDTTIDSALAALAQTKADVLLNVSYGKFTAQSIRWLHDHGWNPAHLLVYGASSAVLLLDDASRTLAKGVISATFYKNPADQSFRDDPDMVAYKAFLKEWAPDVSPDDRLGVNGYLAASMLAYVLKASGNNLTRANVLRQATNINELSLPLLLPGVTISVQSDNYDIFRHGRLQRFDGAKWELLPGAVVAE